MANSNPNARHSPVQVAFVIQKLVGLSGGAERIFIETAEAMADRGISTRLICFDADLTPPLAFGSGRLPITSVLPAWLRRRKTRAASTARHRPRHRGTTALAEAILRAIPNVFPLTYLSWLLSHGLFQRGLKHELRRSPVDVVVAFLPPAITAAVRVGTALDIPVIASTHNVPERDFGNSDRWDQNPLYRQRARQALSNAACVTVLQPEFRSWFPAEVQSRVLVIPNPVSRVCAPTKPAPVREKVVLGVGRLTSIKRWDLLVNGFALAAADLPDWSVRIFGSGPEAEVLGTRIAEWKLEDRIAILPPTPDIGAQYDRASLLVHPSEFEGFGLSVAEAMAHGLPVLAFADCPGVNRLVKDGISGLLLNRPTDSALAAQELATALNQMLHSPTRRAEMGAAATEITTQFNRQSIHDKWAKTIRSLAL